MKFQREIPNWVMKLQDMSFPTAPLTLLGKAVLLSVLREHLGLLFLRMLLAAPSMLVLGSANVDEALRGYYPPPCGAFRW